MGLTAIIAAMKSRTRAGSALTHLDASGAARMVDVGGKAVTERRALARAVVRMRPATRRKALAGDVKKGSVLQVARIAGIQAAKRTPDWIPLCHPLQLSAIRLDFEPRGNDRIEVLAEACAADRTGVEMEALVAASAAALTIYDMLKAVEKGIVIGPIELLEKDGGKSGPWRSGGRR